MQNFNLLKYGFTDQNNRPLEIEDNVYMTLVIGTG